MRREVPVVVRFRWSMSEVPGRFEKIPQRSGRPELIPPNGAEDSVAKNGRVISITMGRLKEPLSLYRRYDNSGNNKTE